ncbi:conserved hypothetical protein [Ricinus communis]|uniref:Uncharacterized protein n=1 Tax=Ricinus communis TaxID=3988 RepID=B9STL8_RICCO|nr:conserved hypothetical protein [Ricinus communis]
MELLKNNTKDSSSRRGLFTIPRVRETGESSANSAAKSMNEELADTSGEITTNAFGALLLHLSSVKENVALNGYHPPQIPCPPDSSNCCCLCDLHSKSNNIRSIKTAVNMEQRISAVKPDLPPQFKNSCTCDL